MYRSEDALERGFVLEQLPLLRVARLGRERKVMDRVGSDRVTRAIRQCEDLVVRQDPVSRPRGSVVAAPARGRRLTSSARALASRGHAVYSTSAARPRAAVRSRRHPQSCPPRFNARAGGSVASDRKTRSRKVPPALVLLVQPIGVDEERGRHIELGQDR